MGLHCSVLFDREFCATGQVVLKGKKFWEKVKNSDLLNYEWYHLQEHQDSFRVPSPLYAAI